MKESAVILVDKPGGITSARVVEKIKRKFKLRRVGHSGTLDPMATGLMVVLCGHATRLQAISMGAVKTYQGEIRLGLETDTDDVTGAASRRDEELAFIRQEPVEVWLERVKKRFSGTYLQQPPDYSALKIQGKRSCDIVRDGQAVVLQARTVTVDELSLSFSPPDILSYTVRCSKGFYVRSLARELGRFLESAACLQSIRRMRSEPFSIEEASPLDKILESESFESVRMPMTRLTRLFPPLIMADADLTLLHRGVQSPLAGIEPLAERLAVYDRREQFHGIVERLDGEYRIQFLLPEDETA